MKNAYYLEMPNDYRELAENYYRQFAPQGLGETSLVDSMVYDHWVRNRALEFVSSYSYDPAQPGLNDMLDIAAQRLPVLERRFARNLRALRSLQKVRNAASPSPKLASFRQNAPRPPRPPALPKTAAGEWVN